ncbi:MAG TPA: YkvA family protein [candidate division Zixibacteria bacterium]|nr:YkvA family protein [candidate division Zixibacteria bacterium]
MRFLERLRTAARGLRRETTALYFVARDPRVPWHARIFILCVVGYALSPLDLIPDTIPILGYLDDLILVPLGVYVALKMVPEAVLRECRERALAGPAPAPSRLAAAVVVLLWIAAAAAVVGYFLSLP